MEPPQEEGWGTPRREEAPATLSAPSPPRRENKLASFDPGDTPWDATSPLPELPARKLAPRKVPPKPLPPSSPALELDESGQFLVEGGDGGAVEEPNPAPPAEAQNELPPLLAELLGQLPLPPEAGHSQESKQLQDTPRYLARIRTAATDLEGTPTKRKLTAESTSRACPQTPSQLTPRSDHFGHTPESRTMFGSQIGAILRERSKETPSAAGSHSAGGTSRAQTGIPQAVSRTQSRNLTTQLSGEAGSTSSATHRSSNLGSVFQYLDRNLIKPC